MSNSTPPDRRRPHLRDDEPIALFVAFLVFGSIFWWALSQGRNGFDLGSLASRITGSTSQTPPISTSPLPTQPVPSPSVSPQPTGDANLEATVEPSPQPTVSPSIAVRPPTNQATSETLNPKPLPPVTRPAIAFPDVPQNYWAYPFIAGLSARGILGGFPGGNFQPNKPVTRAEFAVQLQKAFTKPNQLPPRQFTDVPAGDKWATSVDQAVKANFMSGYPDGTFRPNQEVSRTESVISIARGLGLNSPADAEAILQTYQDQQQIPAWARSKMAAAIQSGVFPSDPTTPQALGPNQPATRADIAALIYKSLELSGQKPAK